MREVMKELRTRDPKAFEFFKMAAQEFGVDNVDVLMYASRKSNDPN